ncbi:MAG: hypothetical protein D6813_00050 [Calditrichaeota bacterium]|nr:MAG: hypothetical protein D6813_00050 [Calditrichota bacterium]
MLQHRNIPLVANSDSKDLVSIGLCHNEIPGKTPQEMFNSLKAGKIRRYSKMEWPTPGWAVQTFSSVVFGYKRGSCGVCGSGLKLTILPRKLRCQECGRVKTSHVVCQKAPHYLCKSCRTRRDYSTDYIRTYREKMGIEL